MPLWPRLHPATFSKQQHTYPAKRRERLNAVHAALAQQEQQAKQRKAAQLDGLAAEAARLEAAARQEGEARCATMQVTLPCNTVNVNDLTSLHAQYKSSGTGNWSNQLSPTSLVLWFPSTHLAEPAEPI